MTLEQLDILRGYAIAILLISVVSIGMASQLSTHAARVARSAAQFIGGFAGLMLFFILHFVAGWDEYFAAKAENLSLSEYQGRHKGAAQVIQSLGEMEASGLGLVFGLVGLALMVCGVGNLFGKPK